VEILYFLQGSSLEIGGPQPLAGKQVTYILVRGHGLKPVFSVRHALAVSHQAVGTC
jgi:hypothetical protein